MIHLSQASSLCQRLFSLLLALLLMISGVGIGLVTDAHAEGAAELPAEDGVRPDAVFQVSTVDELLEAIGPDRVIRLEDGVYNLTEAKSYGDLNAGEYWHWVDAYDGYQLVIRNVAGLWLEGSDAQRCSIVTEPRYANVLAADSSDDLHFSNLTAGHTPGEGYCSGGVLDFYSCSRVWIRNCDLYGCGTMTGVRLICCMPIHAPVLRYLIPRFPGTSPRHSSTANIHRDFLFPAAVFMTTASDNTTGAVCSTSRASR